MPIRVIAFIVGAMLSTTLEAQLVDEISIETCAGTKNGSDPGYSFIVTVVGTGLIDPSFTSPNGTTYDLQASGFATWEFESDEFPTQADLDAEFPSGGPDPYEFVLAPGETASVLYSTWAEPSCFPVIAPPTPGLADPLFSWTVACSVGPNDCHYALEDSITNVYIDFTFDTSCPGGGSYQAPTLSPGAYLFWVEITGNDGGTPQATSTGVPFNFRRSRQRSNEFCYVLNEGFERGDCNADGDFDVADSVYMLSFLFLAGLGATCEDACDSNDNGGLDISDAVFTLSALFVPGSPQPAAPAPGCGEDPTPDALTCLSYSECP